MDRRDVLKIGVICPFIDMPSNDVSISWSYTTSTSKYEMDKPWLDILDFDLNITKNLFVNHIHFTKPDIQKYFNHRELTTINTGDDYRILVNAIPTKSTSNVNFIVNNYITQNKNVYLFTFTCGRYIIIAVDPSYKYNIPFVEGTSIIYEILLKENIFYEGIH